MDLSTLNIDRLRKLQTYTLPGSYRLQDGSGNGCYGDPPGFPTYFTRNVYTQHGNSPGGRNAAHTVICFEGVNYIVQGKGIDFDEYQALLKTLYVPLPIDHPRVRMWIKSTYKHMQHCYQDVDRPEYGKPGTLIFPVPDYKLKSFTDDPRWNDEYREAKRFEVDTFNAMERGRALLIATPENHNAVRTIRRYYPDYQPELDLIENPPEKNIPCWWESEAKKPTPMQCTSTQRSKGMNWKHPINGTWCQWCGWEQKVAKAG